MKRLTLFFVALLCAHPVWALDYSGAVQQIQQTNNCKFSGPYGSRLALSGKVEIFSGICGGNAYVGARQPNVVNAPWSFKNCGAVNVTQPPSMPMNVPPQYIAEEFRQYDAWLLQDSCNLWRPMPVPAEWQNAATQKEKDKQMRSNYWKTQTGCDVLSLSTAKFNEHSNETVQLMCNGQAKVGYADDNGPPQFYVCKAPTDKVMFNSPNFGTVGGTECGHMKTN